MLKVVILILHFVFGIETIVVGPRNAAMVVGQRMEMKCHADSNWTVREWRIRRTSTGTVNTLFVHWGNRSRIYNAHFGVDKDFDPGGLLYANSTTLNDAGMYICWVQQGQRQPVDHTANLIVFETEPLCSSNSTLPLNATVAVQKESYSVWMQCTVNFTGNLIPHIEWRKHVGSGEEYNKGHEITNLVDTVITRNATIASQLTVVFSSDASSLIYSFKMYFKSVNYNSSMHATNAPNYSYTWTVGLPAVDFPSTYLKTDSATILYTSIAVPSIVIIIALAIIVFVCIRRKLKADATFGSTKQADKTTPESKSVIYENVTAHENAWTGDSQAATYMQLTSLTQASQPVYASIDIDGKFLDMPNNPLPDYKNI